MSIHIVRNIGRLDQVLRIGISLGLVYVGLIDEQFIQDPFSSYVIGTVGALNFIIALARFCPLYVIAGINTCNRRDT